MIDLKNASATEALRYAKDVSGLTAKEIADASGVSVAILNRYLNQGDDYSPSMEMIPVLCRTLGNDILLQWMAMHVTQPPAHHVCAAESRADVLTSVARAGAALGTVQRLVTDRSWITPADARELRAAMSEVITVLEDARLSLQPLAETRDSRPRFLASLAPSTEPMQEDAPETAGNVPRAEPWWKFWRKD